MKTMLIAVTVVFSVVGCAASSIKDLKERADISDSFVLQENYQAVYRRAKNDASRCLQGQFMVVDGDIYTDIPKAEILQTGGGRLYTLIEMVGLDENTTRVDYWIIDSSMKRYGSLFSSFFLHGTPMCKE